ncbi:MAG: hypothetical protein QOE68_2920, partial [Thermoanaerobaculia bacterium]|nr:hypothetical protein [Thermoanaerobaculia bacterium]
MSPVTPLLPTALRRTADSHGQTEERNMCKTIKQRVKFKADPA